jgi:hypothetical protein
MAREYLPCLECKAHSPNSLEAWLNAGKHISMYGLTPHYLEATVARIRALGKMTPGMEDEYQRAAKYMKFRPPPTPSPHEPIDVWE